MNIETFGSAKNALRLVVANGVDASDTRVMSRTNEAIQLILSSGHPVTGEPVIPVNGMMTAEVPVADGVFFIPPQMDSVIHFELVETEEGMINQQRDVRAGFYDIVNPFTYLDPSAAHDAPFEDLFLEETAFGVFQRKYGFPGFSHGTIRVTGPKCYIPITQDGDQLIVQNVTAIKRMIQSLEAAENYVGDAKPADDLHKQAMQMIVDEIKRHNSDPRKVLKRKGEYETDLRNFAPGSKGWTRARIALEVPGALNVGKVDIGRLIDRGQLRMMEAGTFKGCIEEFNAQITDGFVYVPSRVESIIAANLCGYHLDVRSIFYKYIENGPGETDCACAGGMLEDAGEVFFPNSNERRRKYRSHVGTDGSELSMVCKLRWTEKMPQEQLTITNLEANRVMVRAMLLEQADKWQEAEAAIQTVLGDGKMGRPMGILHKELKEYLRGIQQIVNFAPSIGVGDLGVVM